TSRWWERLPPRASGRRPVSVVIGVRFCLTPIAAAIRLTRDFHEILAPVGVLFCAVLMPAGLAYGCSRRGMSRRCLELTMEMLAYIVLAAVLYGLLADRIDRAIERETRSRRKGPPDLRLVGDAKPGWPLPSPLSALDRNIRQLLTFARASQQQPAATHVAAADEVARKHEPRAEDR